MPEKIIKAAPPENDPVQKPAHYAYGRYEAIDVITELTEGASGPEGFLLGNIIKYLWRYRRKNGAEDLKKAREYLSRLIQHYENRPAPVFYISTGGRGSRSLPSIGFEDGRPIYNRATAEAAARHIGEMGEFFDDPAGNRFTGRLVRINPDIQCHFIGLVPAVAPNKYVTMPYAFFSPFPPEPPKTGADEKEQEKPEA